MRRHASLLTALALATGGLGLVATPAHAATGTIDALDASTAGHVTGSVTSDAEVVRIRAIDPQGLVADSVHIDVDQTADADTFGFDLSTWGLTTGHVVLTTCDADWSNCTDVATSASFEATEATTSITWAADDGATVTAPAYDVAASDDGGGYLYVGASNVSWSPMVLKKDGTPTTLDLEVEGEQTLTVHRCNDTSFTVCRTLGARTVTVDLPITATSSVAAPWPATIDVDDTPTLDLNVQLSGTAIRDGDYAIFREIRDADGVVQGMGVGQIFDYPSDGDHHYAIGLTHLVTGAYTLRVETTWGLDAEDREIEEFDLDIVNPAPVIASFNRSSATVFPTTDGYQDAVTFRLHPQTWVEADSSSVEIRNAQGALVRSLQPQTDNATDGYLTTWDGRGEDGVPVAAGTYTVTGALADRTANTSSQSTTVRVVRQHVEKRTFTKTVTPAASYARQFVGRCSVVRRPSLRGWSGSFGLYSNKKCRAGQAASLAETQHGMYVPKALRYGSFRVSVRGGAAKARPSSTLRVAYNGSEQGWGHWTNLGPALGWHAGPAVAGSWAVHDKATEPWVLWSSYVTKGRRYDVRSFQVRLDYELLVDD